MTAWAVTQTNRFKSAVMGASVTDLKTMYSTSTKPEYFRTLFGDNPFGEQGKVYLNHSPVTFVNQARTPTLILHGEVDPVVPLTQSYEFYQGLKDKGVINKFVIYPRETHSIREYTHQLDMMRRIVDWFSYYLKNEE
jgi:dipeptidyl aminopeptidase/acylaminoacyl peptidase